MSEEKPHPLEKAAHDFLATHEQWALKTREEMDVLRKLNFKNATDVLKKKTTLSDTYHKQLKFLHEHRAELADLPATLKTALRKSQEEFNALSIEFHEELNMAMKVGERFMNLIKKAITRQLQTSHFYGQSGNLMNNLPPRSVTVNKKA